MSVRFVIGRAGSGKTAHCLSAICERLRSDPGDGVKLILLVPEQASFQMERALIESPEIRGYHRCEVLSFRRLAYRVLGSIGGAARRALTSTGRLMLLRHLLAQHAPSLQVYGRSRDAVGLLKHLASGFTEMVNERIDPADLVARSEADRTARPLLSAKLHDVAVLYSAYLACLGEERLDPAQYLELARERLGDCAWLNGAEVWVDGFAGFTGQEETMLVRLAQVAARTEITLLMDPAAAVLRDSTAPVEPYHLFARTERTFLRLRESLRGAGVAIDAQLLLDCKVPPRFELDHPLALIERRLFVTASAADIPPSSDQDTPQAAREAERQPCVRLVEAANRRVEVDAAVAHIQRLVQRDEDALRYRDIAVIVRSLEPYHDLLSAALDAHDVPYFIDRRQPISHHSVVELVRSLTRVVIEDFSRESVSLLVKTGLLPISQEEADAIENYVLAHGVQGAAAWRDGDWAFVRQMSRGLKEDEPAGPERVRLDRINTTRRRILDSLTPWLLAAEREEAAPARDWAVALYATLERLEVPRQLEAWAVRAEDDGRIGEAAEHRQIWRELVELLDDMVDAVGAEQMSPHRFAASLDAGLSELTLGLTPPTLDQVLVGSIERSRHPELKAVLVLGFNERVFPFAGSEDVIFSDADREHLASIGIELGATRRQRLFDEKLLAYIAMTRPSRDLWISYAAADEQGKSLNPSPFVDAVLAAAPGVTPIRIGDPAATRETWPIGTADELAAYLALELRRRPPRRADDEHTRALWNGVYETARVDEGLNRCVAAALSSLAYRNQASLDPAAVSALYGRAFVASVSRLETFAACPFRHFAAYGLELEQRPTFQIGAIDLGVLHHAILERLVGDLRKEGRLLSDMDDAEIVERVDGVAREVVPQLADEVALSDARSTYILDRSNQEIAEVLKAQRFAARAGQCRPIATELEFGFGDTRASLPALEINTSGGHKLAIRGKIDRVDVAAVGADLVGAVIDYKRSRGKRLDLMEVYHGLSLQLLGYLLALQQRGQSLTGRPIEPAAAFYVGLVPEYRRVDHPSLADEEKQARYKPHKPRGVFDFALLEVLDQGAPFGGWSGVVSGFRDKRGRPAQLNRSDAVEQGQLVKVLDYTRRKIADLADEMLDGNVGVRPYRLRGFMPCGWCPYGSVCRFEFETGSWRSLEWHDRTDALEMMVSSSDKRRD